MTLALPPSPLLRWAGVALLLQTPTPQAIDPASAEGELRAAVQQYYDAQAQRDPDKAAAFWSASANPRPGRDAYVAMFGEPAEDFFTVEIRAVEMNAASARVRVAAFRTRLIARPTGPMTQRTPFLNSQLWRKEPAGWKLLRDGPFAEEIADDLIAARPADRAALIEKTSRPDLVQTRLAISQRATMAITVGRDYVRGRTLFELALDVSRAAGDRRGEANSLHNIAQADFFLTDHPAAIAAYEKELAVGRALDDADIAAGALYGLGRVAYTRAEYTPALGFYREAAALYEKRDDKPSLGRTVVSIGNVEYLQAEYDAAAASYRRGLALALAAMDADGATFAKAGVARVLAAQGDIAAALDMYGQALADYRAALTRDPRLTSNVGGTLESMADLYYRLGNTDQARATLEEARKMFAASPLDAGRVLLGLGLIELVAGRFDAAFTDYSESKTQFVTAKADEGIARAWVGIGFSQTARRKYGEALTAYRTAIDIFSKLNQEPDVARAWLGLSQAQSGADDHKAALASAEKVRAIGDRVKNDDLIWRGSVRAGEALRKLDRPDEARAMFTTAIASIDRLAADAPFTADARSQLEDSASAWAELALTLAQQGDAAGALAAVEARHAHIRRVQFAVFHRDITRGETPEEQADEQGIVREVIATRAQLNKEVHARNADATRLEQLRAQLATLMARRGEQQARLFERLPALRELRALAAPELDAGALSELIATPGTLLVEYVVTDEELLILTLAHGETAPDVAATVAPLDRHAFAETLAAVMQPATLQSAGDWRTRATPLSVSLLDPIAARLADRDRIVFVPDDLLWKVPFEALPHKDSDLAAHATVTYATSIAALLLERRTQAAGTPADAPTPAFLAAPRVPDPIRAQLALAIQGWKEPDAGVSLGAARQAAAAYGDTAIVHSGADATETAARDLLGTVDVIHVSAPLLVSSAAPLLSSVILAATGDTPAQDGRWEAREWFASSGRARVAVVPDGSAFAAAGVGGAMDALAWAANAAGIATLVLGRWPADGFTANDLAAALHVQLAKGLSPAEALRAAAAVAREKDAAPAAWAGLRVIGKF